MSDRRKIIKGLRCHAGCEQGLDCGDCVYFGTADCSERLAKDALALITELQEERQKSTADWIRARRVVPDIVRCKECQHYHSWFGCDLMQKPITKDENYFCADGLRRVMNDRSQDVIDHLQILWVWLTVNPKYGVTMAAKECEKAAQWVMDAIDLLNGREGPG